MGKSSRKQTTHTGKSKYFKRVILGKLEGTWDMATRYFLIKVPVGIADPYIKLRAWIEFIFSGLVHLNALDMK